MNALVDPIFKRKPLRDWSGPAGPVADAFLSDVDGAGNDMDSFMQSAALSSKLYGAVFIVVENFQSMDLPVSIGDALAQRKFPYAYTLDPDRVEGVSIDKNGRVLSIKFRDTAVTSTMGNDKERTVYFDTQRWAVYENGRLVSSGDHNLGEVPVVWFPSQKVKMESLIRRLNCIQLQELPAPYTIIAPGLQKYCGTRHFRFLLSQVKRHLT